MRIRKSQTVQLVARTHGYFPASFRWRGRRFEVLAVEKCWSDSGPIALRTFRVRCQAGRFELQQTIAGDHWRVIRWPLTLWWPHVRRSASPRFPLPKRQRRPAITRGVPDAAPVQVMARTHPLVGKARGEALPWRLSVSVPAQVTATRPLSERTRS